MYFNVGYNASDATYPGLEIISKLGGIERFVTVTKPSGYNFVITNLSSGSISIRLKKEC